MKNLILNLDVFEGPLDLLYHLIKSCDLAISKVSLIAVAEQYAHFVELLPEVDIDGAGEFLAMSAELVLIKSRALLPKNNEVVDEDLGADDLLYKLRQYEMYKMAGEALYKNPVLGRDVFTLHSLVTEALPEKTKKPVSEISNDWSSFDLVKALHEVLLKLPTESNEHQILGERVSVAQRMAELLEQFAGQSRLPFFELFFHDRNKPEVVMTFLALLEMAREKWVKLFQLDLTSVLYVDFIGDQAHAH